MSFVTWCCIAAQIRKRVFWSRCVDVDRLNTTICIGLGLWCASIGRFRSGLHRTPLAGRDLNQSDPLAGDLHGVRDGLVLKRFADVCGDEHGRLRRRLGFLLSTGEQRRENKGNSEFRHLNHLA